MTVSDNLLYFVFQELFNNCVALEKTKRLFIHNEFHNN